MRAARRAAAPKGGRGAGAAPPWAARVGRMRVGLHLSAGGPGSPLYGSPAPAAAPDAGRRHDAHPYGMRTLLMTWITPLLAPTSALMTFALLTYTLPPLTLNVTRLPCSVLAPLSFSTFAARYSPLRTW